MPEPMTRGASVKMRKMRPGIRHGRSAMVLFVFGGLEPGEGRSGALGFLIRTLVCATTTKSSVPQGGRTWARTSIS
jgi:hypothetical protein